MNRILHIVMFACVFVVAFCSCEADEQLPTANGGEHIYTMSLDAALNDYDAATTRVGYNWSDGTILYLQFVVGNQTIVGNATYSKEADAWSVTTTEALANVDSARCEAYFFKDSVQSDSSVISLSESIAVYQDTCGYYVKTDNYLSVSLRLSPKTGRIRFKGESGRKFTIRGMYQLSGYDILENRFDSTKVELSPTVLADGYTPYYYTVFTDTSRTLTVVDGLIEYTKDCSSTILADGKSGYMILPTKENHTGWNAIRKEVVAETVDLGVGVLWASHNVGATVPEEYGDYYAWGETEVKDNYDWSTYKYCNGDAYSMTKYCTNNNYGTVDNKTVLDQEDDVAHVKWGGEWRMPTEKEIQQLLNNCSWEWSSVNGVDGHKVTGPNGNSIFFPTAGYFRGEKNNYRGSRGDYWSNTLGGNYSYGAYNLHFLSGSREYNNSQRYHGHTVRPVYGVSVITGEATDVTDSKVTLNGTVIGTNQEVACGFIYGTSSALSSSNGTMVSTTSNGEYSLSVVDLTYNTTYYYCAYVVIDGEYTYGGVRSFKTKKAEGDLSPEHVEAVDLGLSVKWASCNVDADSPEGYGGYYAWGETVEKTDYSWSTYKWCNGAWYTMTKYCIDSKYGTVDHNSRIDPEDDIAHVKWGGDWRMPTERDILELRDNCSWEWSTVNGVNGLKITGPNGNSIFLPAAGNRYGMSNNFLGLSGRYWSSDLNVGDSNFAYCFYIDDGGLGFWGTSTREVGFSVRPVTK